ncbi:acetyltransferase [Paenibacillus lignilyticus]|uniref:Acetyltransferase n=1 Tax=Paenibacillus lignilyticus TaxID=1172615 RepID=A0ABS5CG46_9BACL|nr:acetyltransferase [Paenibacillus lignilyticus]MBP3964824.1 acetyltransferase [Paenibacillus lignilyticus]
MKDKLLIIGASGHGKVVADTALKMKTWKSIAFLDSDESIIPPFNLEIIGLSNDASRYLEQYDVFVGIGNNAIREKIQDQLELEGASIPVLIHPSAVIGEQVKLASGTIVMAGVVINCYTTVGKGCIVNTSATIDHDNLIGDYVHISPGANLAGTVTIGKGSWLGIGSAVSNNVNITQDCKVGAGTVVIKDLTETGTYVGVPARRV